MFNIENLINYNGYLDEFDNEGDGTRDGSSNDLTGAEIRPKHRSANRRDRISRRGLTVLRRIANLLTMKTGFDEVYKSSIKVIYNTSKFNLFTFTSQYPEMTSKEYDQPLTPMKRVQDYYVGCGLDNQHPYPYDNPLTRHRSIISKYSPLSSNTSLQQEFPLKSLEIEPFGKLQQRINQFKIEMPQFRLSKVSRWIKHFGARKMPTFQRITTNTQVIRDTCIGDVPLLKPFVPIHCELIRNKKLHQQEKIGS